MYKEASPSSIYNAKSLLRKAYQTTYFIYDHLEAERRPTHPRPLASIALHDAEKIYGEGTPVYEAIELFIRNKVSQHMTLDDWLNVPVHIARYVLDICSKVLENEAKAMSDLAKK